MKKTKGFWYSPEGETETQGEESDQEIQDMEESVYEDIDSELEQQIEELRRQVQSFYLEHPEKRQEFPDKIFVKSVEELEEKITEHIPKRIVEDEIVEKRVIDKTVGVAKNPVDFSQMRENSLPNQYVNTFFGGTEREAEHEVDDKRFLKGKEDEGAENKESEAEEPRRDGAFSGKGISEYAQRYFEPFTIDDIAGKLQNTTDQVSSGSVGDTLTVNLQLSQDGEGVASLSVGTEQSEKNAVWKNRVFIERQDQEVPVSGPAGSFDGVTRTGIEAEGSEGEQTEEQINTQELFEKLFNEHALEVSAVSGDAEEGGRGKRWSQEASVDKTEAKHAGVSSSHESETSEENSEGSGETGAGSEEEDACRPSGAEDLTEFGETDTQGERKGRDGEYSNRVFRMEWKGDADIETDPETEQEETDRSALDETLKQQSPEAQKEASDQKQHSEGTVGDTAGKSDEGIGLGRKLTKRQKRELRRFRVEERHKRGLAAEETSKRKVGDLSNSPNDEAIMTDTAEGELEVETKSIIGESSQAVESRAVAGESGELEAESSPVIGEGELEVETKLVVGESSQVVESRAVAGESGELEAKSSPEIGEGELELETKSIVGESSQAVEISTVAGESSELEAELSPEIGESELEVETKSVVGESSQAVESKAVAGKSGKLEAELSPVIGEGELELEAKSVFGESSHTVEISTVAGESGELEAELSPVIGEGELELETKSIVVESSQTVEISAVAGETGELEAESAPAIGEGEHEEEPVPTEKVKGPNSAGDVLLQKEKISRETIEKEIEAKLNAKKSPDELQAEKKKAEELAAFAQKLNTLLKGAAPSKGGTPIGSDKGAEITQEASRAAKPERGEVKLQESEQPASVEKKELEQGNFEVQDQVKTVLLEGALGNEKKAQEAAQLSEKTAVRVEQAADGASEQGEIVGDQSQSASTGKSLSKREKRRLRELERKKIRQEETEEKREVLVAGETVLVAGETVPIYVAEEKDTLEPAAAPLHEKELDSEPKDETQDDEGLLTPVPVKEKKQSVWKLWLDWLRRLFHKKEKAVIPELKHPEDSSDMLVVSDDDRANIIEGLVEGDVRGEHIILETHSVIKSDVVASACFHCKQKSVVFGDVYAAEVIVEGTIRGSIKATKQVSVQENGCVFGNVQAPSIVLDPKGYIAGDLSYEK